jgi:hypothetical protein
MFLDKQFQKPIRLPNRQEPVSITASERLLRLFHASIHKLNAVTGCFGYVTIRPTVSLQLAGKAYVKFSYIFF